MYEEVQKVLQLDMLDWKTWLLYIYYCKWEIHGGVCQVCRLENCHATASL